MQLGGDNAGGMDGADERREVCGERGPEPMGTGRNADEGSMTRVGFDSFNAPEGAESARMCERKADVSDTRGDFMSGTLPEATESLRMCGPGSNVVCAPFRRFRLSELYTCSSKNERNFIKI